MADYVIMPREDYVEICDAVREKTGSESALTSGEVAPAIAGIETQEIIISNKDLDAFIAGTTSDLSIPDTTTEIRSYGFYRMNHLESVTIPDSVTRIGVEAFRECPMLSGVTIPAGTTNVTYRAFAYCQRLQMVSFLGQPEKIQSDVFKDSPVMDIYVPWSEGAVENAPWGATDATIHYNTEVTGQ